MPQLLPKPYIVQKYGGTSIGKLLPTITGSIIPAYLESHHVAVVCSARSSKLKSCGTTSLLLEAIQLATSSETDTVELDRVVDVIMEDHMNAAREAVEESGNEGTQEVQRQIIKDCEQLRKYLKATWTIGEISERTTDRVLAVGELLACRVVAASLKSKGIEAEVIFLDNIVQESYGRCSSDLSNSYKSHPAAFLRGLTDAIRRKIAACNGVPVVTGFFGMMPDSLVSSIGRGYSDLCAALCAIALSASELQIWKEVDGIFTADPRKIKGARLLATVTSEEAAELTYYGSEVIHPLTMEQLDTAGIALRLKNVMRPNGEGTIIFPSTSPSPSLSPKSKNHGSSTPPTELDTEMAKSAFMISHGYYGLGQHRRTPTAVTTKENMSILTIRSHGTVSPSVFLSQTACILEKHSIVIDLISSSQQMLSLAIYAPQSRLLEKVVEQIEHLGTVSIVDKMSIVSVVGHKMRNMVGIAAEIFAALASAKVNIYLISQGASEINISFVVKASDAQVAVEVVHTNVMRIPLHEEKEIAFVKGPWLY